jgi:CRISPR-associated endonuclease Cas2
MSAPYLIIYDISSTKRRNKVARLIEQVGVRIQYSSFYCFVPKTTLFEILTKLYQLIDKRTDSIVVVHLPDNWEKYVIGTLKNPISNSRKTVL